MSFNVSLQNRAQDLPPTSCLEWAFEGVFDLYERVANFINLIKYKELREPLSKCHHHYPQDLKSRFHAGIGSYNMDWHLISIPSVMRKFLTHHRNGELFEANGDSVFIHFLQRCFGQEVKPNDCILFCEKEFSEMYRSAFHRFLKSSKVSQYIEKIEEMTAETINSLPSEGDVNISAVLRVHALKVICTILLEYPGPYDELVKALEFSNAFIIKNKVDNQEEQVQLDKTIQTFQSICNHVMTSVHEEDSFIYHLMQQMTEEKMTETQVKILIFIALFAGEETSSYLFIYSMFELAKATDEQNKVLSEILEYQERSAAFLIKQLSTLKNIFAESIRLFTPSYVAMREPKDVVGIEIEELKDETVVRSETFTIRKSDQQIIFLTPTFAGRNPAKYPDPDHFIPDRFIDTHAKLEWLPFSYGPHACPGQWLATAEFKMWILKFIQAFEFTTTQESLSIKGHSTLIIEDDLILHVRRR